MSLNDSLDAVQRAKLAVWDYPVSNKYTKLWETMQETGFPNSLDEAIRRVEAGDFAYIGELLLTCMINVLHRYSLKKNYC